MIRWLICSCLFILMLNTGCIVMPPEHHRHGPPHHVPAPGYRMQYHYRYYPEVGVYYDINRSLYFYMDNGWRCSQKLPGHMRLIGAPVVLDLDDDTPYSRYYEHREHYPARARG